MSFSSSTSSVPRPHPRLRTRIVPGFFSWRRLSERPKPRIFPSCTYDHMEGAGWQAFSNLGATAKSSREVLDWQWRARACATLAVELC